MRNCCRCGAETQLFSNGVPVCLNCVRQVASQIPTAGKGSQTDGTPSEPTLPHKAETQ